MKTVVATTVLLLIQGVIGQSCGLTEMTLSTDCSDACSQYEPCLAYGASMCPSKVLCVTSDQCAIQCFSKTLNDPDTFTFLVMFGMYDKTMADSSLSLLENEVNVIPDETDTYASISNDAVSTISTIALQPTATSFIVIGGTSTTSSVKSKVAKVTFGSDVISTQTSVTNVVLKNVDLSTSATLQQLPVVLPAALQNLSLANTMLTSFPTVVANFTSLQKLDLDMNYITEIAATTAMNSLMHISFRNNDLDSFRAVFPNLVSLDLTDNKFASIPLSIYIHYSLDKLTMKGNPLASPWFTQDQADFLSKLTLFDLENSDFAKSINSCSSANQRKVHALTEALWVAYWSLLSWCSLQSGYTGTKSATRSATQKVFARLTFYGVSPPLSRSSADKGYRGGRRTPVSGGPRFCPNDYEDDGSNFSPRISTRSTYSNKSATAYSLWNDEELLSLQVKYDEIEDIGTIGSGACGVIWLVKYRGSQLLASKRLRSDQITKWRTQAFIEEIKMVAPFDHPNVVRLIGCAWTIETDLQALFEYMENGDLRDFLLEPSSPRHWSPELLQLAVDIIEALVYIHSFTPPLVHRDLKSRNVMLSGEMKAKVTDFGASRYKSVNETMTAAVGTGRWLAPEVISGSSKYDQSVDVFSFGVVLSEMDTHTIPYDDVRDANGNRLNDIAILQLVANGQLRPKFGASCPPELRMVAERCLNQDPQKRPPAHVIAYELRVIQRSHYTLL
ncbi:unnamed protein product [Peronospora belbahrii]|uniref:Protein kinase domain-containing protein n=1 Tax=Peronospora belbahrii TaxID=622444 RepID=A0AAU9LF71_9STRA|nr:unnamed protein product [Peronospora belbahrii]